MSWGSGGEGRGVLLESVCTVYARFIRVSLKVDNNLSICYFSWLIARSVNIGYSMNSMVLPLTTLYM